jgi:hypothetical protein
MKAFLAWCLLALGGFSGLALIYHVFLLENPRSVSVIIDTSFPMREALPHIPPLLAMLEHQHRYARYVLYTEKGQIHEAAPHLDPGRLVAYAPRDFSRLMHPTRLAEFDKAYRVYVISNAPPSALGGLPHRWTVLRPSALALESQ